MTARRAVVGCSRLSAPLARMLRADSIPRVLSEAASLMADLAGAHSAAAFTADGDGILEEAWYPDPDCAEQPPGQRLRKLALEALRREIGRASCRERV